MNSGYKIIPKYIDGDRGQLFSLLYQPDNMSDETECFVVASSFAEEMNRCRYMCTMLAQSLAEHGYAFLSVDPYGVGDSEGDFVEADWGQANKDLLTGIAYAEELGFKEVSILGVRLGALQAMQILPEIKNLKRLILWQPVINGQSALTQFLRIKIAASIGRNETPGTISDFDAQIENGESIEVAGYDVSPGLYTGMKRSRFEDHIDTCTVPVGWFTTLPSEDRKTPRADINMIEKWQQNGTTVNHRIVYGPSYWQVHERTLVPELVDATVQYIMGE